MKKIRRTARKLLVVALTGAMIMNSGIVSTITVHADAISDAKDEQSKVEGKKKEAQALLDSLNDKKTDLTTYIKKLDAEYDKIQKEIDDLNDEIDQLNEDIKKKQKELKKAKAKEKQQYNAMQKRLQFLYEQGDESYLEMVLTASSMSDILNRSEYVSSISDYDYNMLMDLIKIRRQIADEELKLETDLQNLSEKRKKVEEDGDALQTLIDAKKKKLEEYNNQIESQEETMDQIKAEENEIASKIKKLEKEEAERRKAAEAAAAAANKDSSSGGGGGGTGSVPADDSINYSGGSLAWPCGSHTITSRFGYRKAPTAGASTFHKGIDIGLSSGSSVYSAADGQVITVSYDKWRGNYIQVYHGDGLVTIYEHLSSFKVSVGDTVSKGQTIARSGSTGVSTGPHLHFGVSKNGSYVNPLNYY